MQKIAMLGSGFIGRFYAESIHGQRGRDRVVAIYARRDESAKSSLTDYGCDFWSSDMEEVIAHPDVNMVCIALPNNIHEQGVALCQTQKGGRFDQAAGQEW
jgi:predicted dehydrogenase